MKMIFTLSRKLFVGELAVLGLLIFQTTGTSAQVCSSPNTVIYGLTAAGVIYPITVSTANVGSAVNSATGTPNEANGVGYNTFNGKFYYFNSNPNEGNLFVSYNPSTNTYATLATFPSTNTVHTGTVNFNGTGYYCSDIEGIFYYYNITLNTWTTITSKIVDQSGTNVSTTIIAAGENSGDMAADGYGDLWIVTSSSSNYGLYEIKAPLPTTAQASVTATRLIAPTTATPDGSFEGIAFTAGGALYLSTSTNILYYLSSPSSASMTKVGTFNVSGVGNDLTSCSYPFSVLPVNWVSFTATENNKTTKLNWIITQSIDSKGFNVQRSFDGGTWETLGFVEDTSTNSALQSTYAYTDLNPVPGNNYYRIAQVDENGNINYSSVKMITIATTSKVSVWPNPATDVVYINNSGGNNTKMVIYDLLGKMISTSALHSGINSVNVSNLPTGTYIVHTQNANGEVENEKMIKR